MDLQELVKDTEAAVLEALKAENRKLKAEARSASRELIKRDRTISALETNFNIKLNMYSALLKQNEKRQMYLTHLMKNSVDFLLLVDENLNIAYCADSFIAKIGTDHSESIENKNILDIYSRFADEDVFAALSYELKLAISQDRTSQHDIIMDINGRGEMRFYRVTNTPMTDEDINAVIINWNDITDMKEAVNHAEQANRAKSDFLATMSHEIRTPMNAILGVTQMELQDVSLPEKNKAALDRIYDSGNTLLGIINDILDMSKIETGKLELKPNEYDIPSLIHDAAQVNSVRIGAKNISFIIEASPDLPNRMFGDELRIKQILNNLLSNAFKYTKEGHVKLSVSHAVRDDGDISLILAVEDTGQGMKQEDCDKLFSENYLRFNMESNRTTEGTGIGLNITQRLVELMNGNIKVRTEYGKGSVFIVTLAQKALPCANIGKEITEKLKNFDFSGKKERKNIAYEIMPYGRILIVDDVETNLYVAEGLMSPYQMKIETAISGFAAIEKIKNSEAYDIIFMDHMMPMMDGIETTQKIRALGYTAPIIALTANAIIGNDKMFKENGFNDFISKPIDVRRLNLMLNRWLRDKNPEKAAKFAGQKISAKANTEANIDTKLIEVFLKDAKRAAQTLRETEKTDLKLYITTVHAMKSALANIGKAKESEAAFLLEEAGRKKDTDFIFANSQNFIESLEAIIKELTPVKKEVNESNITEDKVYLKENLLFVKTACEDYDDSGAYSALDKIKEKQWKKETFEVLEEIHDTLFFHSDFEKAAQLANELIGA
ncbi:MAG: ATP-binding protein [Lachnospiraceae bacterium]|nr:ATP-binding protein [Lachnospiraceae bacterium]